MIKKIIKAFYAVFISIISLSIILAVWTAYSFISQPAKSSKIIDVLKNIYENQKTVIIDVTELSKILVKDINNVDDNENNNLLLEADLLIDLKNQSQLDESSVPDDNGDNPLGIVIEPSLPEVSEKPLPDISE